MRDLKEDRNIHTVICGSIWHVSRPNVTTCARKPMRCETYGNSEHRSQAAQCEQDDRLNYIKQCAKHIERLIMKGDITTRELHIIKFGRTKNLPCIVCAFYGHFTIHSINTFFVFIDVRAGA